MPRPGIASSARCDHRRLGRVDHDRRLDGHRQQFHDLRHLLGFVGAFGERHAHVEHVRARVELLARHVGDPLVVVGEEEALHFARALRVHPLADEQRLRVLVEVDRAHRRRRAGNARAADAAGRGSRLGLRGGRPRAGRGSHTVDDRRKMLGSGAAAAADDANAEPFDELAEHVGHRRRLERIDRVAGARVERKPGVRNARHRSRRVAREIADRLAHVLRAGGAIQSDDVDRQRLERRHRARDVGAEQHAAARVERHLRLNRDPPADLVEETLETGDRRLHLEDVLRGLDEQDVHTTFDEVFRLLVVVPLQLFEGRIGQDRIAAREQQARRADRSGDEARPFGCGVLVAGGAREPCRGDVQLPRLLPDAPLAQPVRRRLEGARLDHVASDLEERLVDRLDDVGAGEDQVVVAPLERPAAEILSGRVMALNVRPHRAVEHDHAARDRREVRGLGRAVGRLLGTGGGRFFSHRKCRSGEQRKMPAALALGLAL